MGPETGRRQRGPGTSRCGLDGSVQPRRHPHCHRLTRRDRACVAGRPQRPARGPSRSPPDHPVGRRSARTGPASSPGRPTRLRRCGTPTAGAGGLASEPVARRARAAANSGPSGSIRNVGGSARSVSSSIEMSIERVSRGISSTVFSWSRSIGSKGSGRVARPCPAIFAGPLSVPSGGVDDQR